MNAERFGALFVAAIGIGIIAAVVTFKTSVWKECRQTNSFVYCWQLIGK